MKKHLAAEEFNENKRRKLEITDQVLTKFKKKLAKENLDRIKRNLSESKKNKCLDLSNCTLSDETLSQILRLSAYDIEELNLDNAKIGSNGAKAIAEALKNNTSLKKF